LSTKGAFLSLTKDRKGAFLSTKSATLRTEKGLFADEKGLFADWRRTEKGLFEGKNLQHLGE
jgi:hypothetical protein